MKKSLKVTMIALATAILCNSTPIVANNSQDSANPTMKIGIFYGTSAVPTTNLDNYTGSGHAFGYFDDNDEFVEIYDTDIEEVTTMKDTNIYLGTDNLYYDTKPSNINGTIGAYHVELSRVFDNANDALYVANNTQNGFVAYIDGQYKVRAGSYTSESDAQAAVATYIANTGDTEASVAYPTSDTYTVTNTKTTTIIFEYSNDTKFGIMPKGDITWNKGYRYYGGFEYNRLTGGDLTVINVVSMQDYIKGVIPYEMSGTWHIEALKAQALTARSYAFNHMNGHASYGFDLCNSTCCQVYRGTSQATDTSDQAVDETYGEYIDYNGEIVTGFFYSSNGGATEDSENVWTQAIAYLRGKVDPYENTDEVPNGVWETTVTNSQILWILQAKNYDISSVSNMYISKYTDMGNVYTLTIVDSNGKEYNFSKESARTILNSTTQGVTVSSIRYRINEVMPGISPVTEPGEFYINENIFNSDSTFYIEGANGVEKFSDVSDVYVITASGIDTLLEDVVEVESEKIETASGTYVINGRGWGHNVGMSQYGAKAMAEMGFTYEEIVEFYYTDVDVKTM